MVGASFNFSLDRKTCADFRYIEIINFQTIKLSKNVAHWFNPLLLQPEQSGGQRSIPGRVPILERHDKESRTRLAFI